MHWTDRPTDRSFTGKFDDYIGRCATRATRPNIIPVITTASTVVRFVWDGFNVLLGRTFVFGLRTKKVSVPKKPLKT